MNVMVGSKNPTKIQAVEDVFTGYDVISIDVSSDVSRQPFSDEETRLCATNRAKQAATNDDLGIGLEGGVMYWGDELYLCNWGALVTRQGDIFTASGGRTRLPKELDTQLQAGDGLGDIIDHTTRKQ